MSMNIITICCKNKSFMDWTPETGLWGPFFRVHSLKLASANVTISFACDLLSIFRNKLQKKNLRKKNLWIFFLWAGFCHMNFFFLFQVHSWSTHLSIFKDYPLLFPKHNFCFSQKIEVLRISILIYSVCKEIQWNHGFVLTKFLLRSIVELEMKNDSLDKRPNFTVRIVFWFWRIS